MTPAREMLQSAAQARSWSPAGRAVVRLEWRWVVLAWCGSDGWLEATALAERARGSTVMIFGSLGRDFTAGFMGDDCESKDRAGLHVEQDSHRYSK